MQRIVQAYPVRSMDSYTMAFLQGLNPTPYRRVNYDEATWRGLEHFALLEGFMEKTSDKPDVASFLYYVANGYLFSPSSVVGSTLQGYFNCASRLAHLSAEYEKLKSEHQRMKDAIPNIDKVLNLTFEDIWKANFPQEICPANLEDISNDSADKKLRILKDILAEITPTSNLLSGGLQRMTGLNGSGKAFGHLSDLRQSSDSLFHLESFMNGFAQSASFHLKKHAKTNKRIKKALQKMYNSVCARIDELSLMTLQNGLTHKALDDLHKMMKESGLQVMHSPTEISRTKAKQKRLVEEKVDGIVELPGGHGANLIKVTELFFMKLVQSTPELMSVKGLKLSTCFDSVRLGCSAQSGTEHTDFAMNLIGVWDDAVQFADCFFDQETRLNSPASYVTFLLIYLQDSIENIKANLWDEYGLDLKAFLGELICADGRKIAAGLHFYRDDNGNLTCIDGRKRSMSDPAAHPELIIPLSIEFRGDLKGLWHLVGMKGAKGDQCCLYCHVKSAERHLIFDIAEVPEDITVDDFCKERAIPADVFWLVHEVLTNGGQCSIVHQCMFGGKCLSKADVSKLNVSKRSKTLKRGQKVVVLKQDHGMEREHEVLKEHGLDCKSLVICVLHLKLRIVYCVLKCVYKTAQRKHRTKQAQSILHKSGIKYKLEENNGKLPNLTGKQCDDLLNRAMGPLLDLLYDDVDERNRYTEIYKELSSVLSTLSCTHVSHLTDEDIGTLATRINSFVIRYVVECGDKELFSAVYFHFLSAGHVAELFHYHLSERNVTLGALSMSSLELRHRICGRPAWRKGLMEGNAAAGLGTIVNLYYS
ncbi:hypothetical protein GUITHDRAFT_149260 [Guillardia theta CCMP2712]|uniref:Uncharacterized protein n=2 Tax=Guillardia theta (strain CCMP2712) TaxID=905079 RepID=L1I6K1_GUITC|nr:hypothetical protein GUITHDRAFT_149260 [Guillardia theta CCMP2712]EKX31495.1 hypothetical protein GUITHDRAFT_149260 [Guillardia theta CCMP2712]|eukprot:XP_005818475.1 hypothetical protein GUITHDRAFT_149260 [Guillardia theta CCMP2712]